MLVRKKSRSLTSFPSQLRASGTTTYAGLEVVPTLKLGQGGLHFFGGVVFAGAVGDFDAVCQGAASIIDTGKASQ